MGVQQGPGPSQLSPSSMLWQGPGGGPLSLLRPAFTKSINLHN